MIAPTPYTLPTVKLIGGASKTLGFHAYFHSNKKPFDLTDCTANFAVIHYINDEGDPLISKRMQIEISAIPSEQEYGPNILIVTLTSDETLDLFGKYIYQITISDKKGRVDIPDHGILYVYKNIDPDYVERL